MRLDVLAFLQSFLIGLKLFNIITCSWWVVFLPILAIPVGFILYILIGMMLVIVRDFLLGRLR